MITNELNQTTHRLDVVIKEFEKEKKTHFESRVSYNHTPHTNICMCICRVSYQRLITSYPINLIIVHVLDWSVVLCYGERQGMNKLLSK